MLNKASSEIWEALSIGPQWLLRETEDPLLPASIAPTRSVRDDASSHYRLARSGGTTPSVPRTSAVNR